MWRFWRFSVGESGNAASHLKIQTVVATSSKQTVGAPFLNILKTVFDPKFDRIWTFKYGSRQLRQVRQLIDETENAKKIHHFFTKIQV